MAYSIDYIYRLIDKYTQPLGCMAAAQKRFNMDLKRGQQDLKNFGRGLKKVSFVAVTGGLIATAALIKRSTRLFDIQQESVANVEAGLESTGGVAGRTLEQLQEQASDLQKNTFFGDETILKNVTAQMLTFTNVTGDSFDKAQQAVLDVTAKLHGLNASSEATKSVSIMLGKALNDPVANLGALSRSGIQFSKDQKTVIKSLWEGGKQAEAQAMILAELEKQYGGTAEALAKTAGGMGKQIQNQIGDIQELIGAAINPLRMEWLKLLKNVLPKLLPYIKKLEKYITDNKEAILNGFIKPFKMAGIIIAGFTKMIIKLWPLIKIAGPIILGVVAAWKAYRIAMMVAAAGQMILNAVMAANPIGIVITAIGVLIGLIYIMHKNWAKITAVMGKFGGKVLEVWDNIKGFMMFILPGFTQLVELIRIIVENWGYVKKSFTDKGFLSGIYAIGKAIVAAFISPIESLLEAAGKIPKIGDWAKKAAGGLKKFREGLFPRVTEEKLEAVGEKTEKIVKKTREEAKKPIDLTKITDATRKNIAMFKEAQYKAKDRFAFQEMYVSKPGDRPKMPDKETTVNANMDLRVYNETNSKVAPMKKSDNLGYNEVM